MASLDGLPRWCMSHIYKSIIQLEERTDRESEATLGTPNPFLEISKYSCIKSYLHNISSRDLKSNSAVQSRMKLDN